MGSLGFKDEVVVTVRTVLVAEYVLGKVDRAQ